MVEIWHCNDTRSMRVLWTLGTVPFFKHDSIEMTESSGICLYLSQTVGNNALSLLPEHQSMASA